MLGLNVISVSTIDNDGDYVKVYSYIYKHTDLNDNWMKFNDDVYHAVLFLRLFSYCSLTNNNEML